MTPEEIKREERKQRRLQRLGTDTPRCTACGETHWTCFESHHIAGQHHDQTTVLVCINCHRKLTEQQKGHPPRHDAADAFLESVGHFLLGLADLCRAIIEKLVQFGHELIARSRLASSDAGEI